MLGYHFSDGLIISQQVVNNRTIRSVSGDHHFPSQRNIDVTSEILDLLNSAGKDTLMLIILTRGGGDLLSAPEVTCRSNAVGSVHCLRSRAAY